MSNALFKLKGPGMRDHAHGHTQFPLKHAQKVPGEHNRGREPTAFTLLCLAVLLI